MNKTTFKKGVNQSRNMETMIFANKNRLRMKAGAKSPRFHLSLQEPRKPGLL